jgi:hypothetical protein
MKKFIAWTAAAILAAAVPAAAGIRIGLGGGYALTPDANQGNGLSLAAHVSFDLSPNLAVELGALRYQSAVTASGAGLSTGTLSVVPIELSLKVHFPLSNSLQLFLAGGGGAYLPHFSPDAAAAAVWTEVGFTPTEKLNTAFGFHVRGGLELALGRGMGLILETRYALSKADGSWTLMDAFGGPALTGKITGYGLDAIVFGLGLTIAL